jgi:XRE family transcriptional regulator, regulator of sulfur utilization
MNLGLAIANLRKAKSFKQGSLAEMCNITQAYLSQIESNKKEPNLAILKIISEKLDVPLPVIFFLSIDKDDVPDKKKASFEMLQPMVKAFVKEVYDTAS